MRFRYTKDEDGNHRPLVNVALNHVTAGSGPIEFMCLIDTGSPLTIFPVEIRDAIGLADVSPVMRDHIELSGAKRNGFMHVMDVEVLGNDDDKISIPAQEVWFVDGPPLPVAGILGGRAMHGLVTVFREAEAIFHIRPLNELLVSTCPHCEGGTHPL